MVAHSMMYQSMVPGDCLELMSLQPGKFPTASDIPHNAVTMDLLEITDEVCQVVI